MTRKSSCHLFDMLAEVPDPRNNKGKRHPLVSILALVVIGLMCGHNGWTSIATWARSQPALAKALGWTHKKTPCAATIHNLLKKLDVVVLENILTKWVNKVIQTGEETHKVQYGRTSLSPEEAAAERLLTIRRGHWTIENKVHWVRDVVFREDVSPVRCGAIPQVMAAMQRTAMSVLRFSGYTAITKATHFFASKPKLAVKLIK